MNLVKIFRGDKILLLLLLVLVCSCTRSRVQTTTGSNSPTSTNDSNKIIPVFKSSGQYFSHVLFVWSGDTVIVDVLKENPFKDINLKLLKESYGLPVYDLENIDLEQVMKEFIGFSFDDVPDELSTVDGQVLVSDTVMNKEFVTISYNLYFSDLKSNVVSIKALHRIYNSKGLLVNEFYDDNAGLTPSISSNGQYLLLQYGGDYNGEDQPEMTTGIKVVDVETKNTILNYSIPKQLNNRNVHYFGTNSYFVVVTKSNRETVVFHIVDPENANTVFYEKFHYLEKPRIDSHDYYGENYVITTKGARDTVWFKDFSKMGVNEK